MEYFYTDGKERKGPLSLEDLVKLIRTNSRCYIWKPGMGAWVPPNGIPEVIEALKKATATPPPLPQSAPPAASLQTQTADPFKVQPKVQSSSQMQQGQGIASTPNAQQQQTQPVQQATQQLEQTFNDIMGSGEAQAQQGGTPKQKASGTTSSKVLYDYPKCSAGKRIGGYLIDSVIVFVALIPAYIFIILSAMDDALMVPMLLIGVLLYLLPLGYILVHDGLGRGQSIGKRVVNLMVVDLTTNQPCSKGKSALRNVITIVLSIIYIGIIVDIVMLFAHDKGKRVGDLVANTMVIDVESYTGK